MQLVLSSKFLMNTFIRHNEQKWVVKNKNKIKTVYDKNSTFYDKHNFLSSRLTNVFKVEDNHNHIQ